MLPQKQCSLQEKSSVSNFTNKTTTFQGYDETDCAGAVSGVQQLFKRESRLHRYLLVQHPHVGHLSLVVLVQPSQLLADLLHVVVLPDQLDVVLSHRLQLVFQLSVLAGQTAVQSAEENTAASAIKDKLKNVAGLFCAMCIVKKKTTAPLRAIKQIFKPC